MDGHSIWSGNCGALGILSTLNPGDAVQILQLSQQEFQPATDFVALLSKCDLPEIQSLLLSYSNPFVSKVSFPPTRACSHSIPLIHGSRSVSIRPYKYALALKTEIETQIVDMLKVGLIQPSDNPFSSPVILVKKKDNSFRLCVDYRHLNAITMKGKYLMPIIDEFLDELNGATWFSRLDLCSGFHQIQMDPTDTFKTAFQTHNGHYEFGVISFGLTGAPHSFQKAMNSTLASLLRRCVLLFFNDILVYSQSYDQHVQHLESVFQLLKADQWFVKLSKCSFATREVS
jgi:hypothetical protein